MRHAFASMLGLSVAIHLLLIGSVAFFGWDFHWPTRPDQDREHPASLVLLPANPSPRRPQSAPVPVQKIPRPVAVTQPPVRHEDTPKPGTVAVLAKPEAKPPRPSPESILCPANAPKLDATRGVVFLLDVSGSMYEPFAGTTRLALAREALAQRIRALPDGTPFAITVYAETARTSGPLVAASDTTRDAAVAYINEEFDFGGGTDLPAGFASAQALHPANYVLVTDGDLDTGTVELLGKAEIILGTQGVALDVIGIAPRANTKAETQLHALADQEGGSYVEETAP